MSEHTFWTLKAGLVACVFSGLYRDVDKILSWDITQRKVVILYRRFVIAYLSRNVGNYWYTLQNIPEESRSQVVGDLRFNQNWRVATATVSRSLSSRSYRIVSCRVVSCRVVSCRVVSCSWMGSEPQSVTSESRDSASCSIAAASAEMAAGSFYARNGWMRLTPTCSWIILG
jgi:hypothetical protein